MTGDGWGGTVVEVKVKVKVEAERYSLGVRQGRKSNIE